MNAASSQKSHRAERLSKNSRTANNPQSKDDAIRGGLHAWLSLVRIPNVFTIIADVTAAFMLILGGSGWYTGRVEYSSKIMGVWLISVASAVVLYWSGMILNDVFDLRRDVRNRRGRPLATRAISVAAARRTGYLLLLAGIGFATLIGVLMSDSTDGRFVPAIVATLLSICIVLYDGPLKRKPIAPVAMGACRVLSFLLGATSANAVLADQIDLDRLQTLQVAALGETVVPGCPTVALVFAIGMGIYIGGLTTFGRRESIGDRTIHLPIGLAAMLIGTICLAVAPGLAPLRLTSLSMGEGEAWKTAWRVDPTIVFPAAIFLMLATTLFRGSQAARDPSPARIQATIRSGLLAIIPIAAAITMLAAGAKIALLVFALMIPSTGLAARFRMT